MKKLHLGSSLRAIIPLLINFAVLLSLNGQNLSFSTPPPPPPPGVDSAWTPTTKGDINYLLLIPFNDHGKWGWSDTLGNIVIQPKFKQARFFYQTVVENKVYYNASVTTHGGRNLFTAEKGLLVPESYELLRSIDQHLPSGRQLVRNTDRKYGLYLSATERLITKTFYDTVSWEAISRDVILLKNRSDKTYMMYSPDKKRMVKTDIVQVREVYVKKGAYANHIALAMHKNGKYSKTSDGKLTPYAIDADIASQLEEEDGEWIGVALEEAYQRRGSSKVPTTIDFSRNPSAQKYGFQKLVLQKQDGKMGVVNENGEIILPFIYDEIVFADTNTEAQLYLNGKEGRKIFFSHYPVIEPKYDSILPHEILRVNNNWNFGVFKVKIGNNEGYVGENGVEYFRFD